MNPNHRQLKTRRREPREGVIGRPAAMPSDPAVAPVGGRSPAGGWWAGHHRAWFSLAALGVPGTMVAVVLTATEWGLGSRYGLAGRVLLVMLLTTLALMGVMRIQRTIAHLTATVRSISARASIAAELNSSGPIQTSLARICDQLAEALMVESVLVAIDGSVIEEGFLVGVGGGAGLRAADLLRGAGPAGKAFQQTATDALRMVAQPGSPEHGAGMGDVWVAPIRGTARNLGIVLAAGGRRASGVFDRALLTYTAAQVAPAMERLSLLASVQRQASIDELTGLYNHRFLVDYLEQQAALAERLGKPLALLLLDIDHFKVLNDTLGHQAGDAALRAFARTIRKSLRRADLAGRYGGDEFVVVMSGTGVKEARLVAEKIRSAVAACQAQPGSAASVAFTVSIGGAAFPGGTRNASELFEKADRALYRAKREGRDRVIVIADEAGEELRELAGRDVSADRVLKNDAESSGSLAGAVLQHPVKSKSPR